MLGGFLAILAAATFGLNSVAIRRGVLTGTVAQGLAITVPIAAPIFFVATFSTGNLFIVGGLSYKTIILLGLAGITHFIVGRYANYRATKAMGANLTGPFVSSSLILTLILAIIFLDEIIDSTLVLGFRPSLSFLFRILKVPKDEIFILFDFIISDINVSKKLSTIFEDKFFENPRFLYILEDNSFRVKFLFVIN